MNALTRRHRAIFVVPMVIGLLTAARIVPHLRTVDFLTVFASGVVFGVSLMGLIQTRRTSPQS